MAESERTTRILSRGDLVADGTYRVHSRFLRAVNLTDGRTVASLVARGVEAGPINLVVDRLDSSAIRTVRVDGPAILIDGVPADTRGAFLYDSSLGSGATDVRALKRNLRSLAAVLAESAPVESLAFLVDPSRFRFLRPGFQLAYARHMRDCACDIFYGVPLRGVERMKGCGLGFTPSGDDFIAGLLVALHALERAAGRDLCVERNAVREAAATGGLLSATLIALAAEGRVFESVKALVAVLSRGSYGELRAAAERLLAIGATSGADTAVGLCLGMLRGLAGWPGETPSFARRGVRAHAAALAGDATRGGEEARWS